MPEGKRRPLISIGSETASLGERAGPGLSAEEVPAAIERLVDHYMAQRRPDETFLHTYRRLGHAGFKEALHADH